MSSSLSSCLCLAPLTANSTKPIAPLGSSDRIPLTFHGWTLILKVFCNLNDSMILLTLACSELYLGTPSKTTVWY